jgi:hypothetical protein
LGDSITAMFPFFKYFSLSNRLFYMLDSVKNSIFFTLKFFFFTLELLFFTLEGAAGKKVISRNYFFSRRRKSHDKPDLDVPRWMGAHLTCLELSTGKDKQVIAFKIYVRQSSSQIPYDY